ncbi:hypothetical protein BHE74_00044921, partial [Ensete ventricosum]
SWTRKSLRKPFISKLDYLSSALSFRARNISFPVHSSIWLNYRLEQESGFYFNMKHFEDLVQAGEWDEVERYLGGFTKVEDNRYSMKIFFEIRKQKYLEALDRLDFVVHLRVHFSKFHCILAFILNPFAPGMDYQTADSEHLMKRMRMGQTDEQVWDATTGQKQYTFEGHDAPVYSVCPHYKESIQVLSYPLKYKLCKINTLSCEYLVQSPFLRIMLTLQFIFSTAIDGKIKAWLYDCLGSRVDYDAPGRWCTTMAYSADGTR